MKALITGASSGLGRDMARILADKGYDLILVARRKTKLEKLQKELKTNVEIIPLDISSTYNCMSLYNQVKKEDIDILINNAGFGLFGEFVNTNVDKELDMIDTNIKAVHVLTKLFLKDFVAKDKGYILNVSSGAAFLPGPLMATYYATKTYIYQLTESINEELRHNKSNVYIGALCPGPVSTEFNKVAKVNFSVKEMNSYDVSEYAIKQMFKKKKVIIPGIKYKLGVFACRFLPLSTKQRISYKIQNGKR